MQSFDLIVIGSGPAGQRAAIQGSKMGKHVGLIERREVIGGVCINSGTIPSKTIREAVLHLSGYYYQNVYGVNYRVKDKITMADLAFRVQHVIKTEVDVIQAQLSRNNIEMINGVATFLDPNTVRVDSARGQQTYTADAFIIATGTKPAASSKIAINGRNIIDSDQILSMPEIPKTLIVVGGGVIGVEYTCMFATLGVRVILIEKRPRLLEFADAEMVEALSYNLRDHRVTMRLNEEVESVEEMPDGSVVAYLESKKKISGDALLYSVGRQGNVDELNLPAAQVDSDARGRIPVDTCYRTKQPHIFAVGDVIGFPSLASVSMEQGRIACANAFGKTIQSNPASYPYGIYTIPEISFIGKTEEQLTDDDVPYEVGVAYYREIARGQIRGDTTGRLKIIFHRETKAILGVHIIGEGAT
jgi:NAD(P) transhydrogenase